ncbi:MAG: DUF1559 domain-containing protein [Planctomycetales bacterium]|nr:DUF1559 domain-containing protein [Planctomycetales bacterium]
MDNPPDFHWKVVSPRTREWLPLVLLLTFGLSLGMWMLPNTGDPSRTRTVCKNNLKRIGLALHNYHDNYHSFPPAYVLGPDGKPWHSWRVLVLPFLEETDLAKAYRFDEPWNGPNNSQLLKRCPEVFRCHSAKGKVPPTTTNYVAVVGTETVWPGASPVSIGEITDGTSNTVLVVEVRDAGIPWLAPYDLSFEEASAGPSNSAGRRPSSFHEHGGNVLMCDGTVRYIQLDINRETLRALFTRDGGEEIPDF